MNDTASNKLLKTIEEPSENIIGFLLTSNIDIILPTIKSRCEILSAKYDSLAKENEESFEIDDTAIKLINLIYFIH